MSAVCEQCKSSLRPMNNASKYGHIDCMKALHENGHPWEEYTCGLAAFNGYLECLKYANENGCPWDSVTVYDAIYGGVDCLKYAIEHASPDTYVGQSLIAMTCSIGKLDCLKYLYTIGIPWDLRAYICAVTWGKMDCLKYAHENGCQWDAMVCTTAAIYGNLECLKYAHENGCPWDDDTCQEAAQHLKLDCLIYAYIHGCPWDFRATADTPKILIDIWRLKYVAKYLTRKWKERRHIQRKRAVQQIEDAWLHHYYRPGGAGYCNAKKRFLQYKQKYM